MRPTKHICLFVQRNYSLLNEEKDESLKELVLQNELKVGELGGLSYALHHPGSRSHLSPLFLSHGCSLVRTESFYLV